MAASLKNIEISLFRKKATRKTLYGREGRSRKNPTPNKLFKDGRDVCGEYVKQTFDLTSTSILGDDCVYELLKQ